VIVASETALVTGAASGIGKALTAELLNSGWKVFAIDKKTDSLVEAQVEFSDQLRVYEGDVRETALFEEITREIEAKKEWIDLWVNCAGVSGIGEFSQTSKSEFDKTVEINLLSVVNLTRTALTHMGKRGKGTVCNISSVAGFVSAPLMSAYCLTKHALVGFCRSLQAELSLSGSPLKVLLVCPGFVDTEIIKKGQSEGFPNWLSPLLAKPDSVAKEILSAYKSGQNEIVPTWNGKAMIAAQKWMPWVLSKSRRLLMARSFTDLFLNRY
jgi:short-subunit dehydrogenase